MSRLIMFKTDEDENIDNFTLKNFMSKNFTLKDFTLKNCIYLDHR